MLFTLQRYEFFSKSQHRTRYSFSKFRCCLPCKGTNFLANHNSVLIIYLNIKMLFTLQRYEFFSKSQRQRQGRPTDKDVVYLAKVRIFQQITTRFWDFHTPSWMLFTLQRYEFFSKSQPLQVSVGGISRCCLPCKGTNFLANHNSSLGSTMPYSDVVYLAKVRIFQQITTRRISVISSPKMLFTLQRYEFFSKSQPGHIQ